jgi:hypothetical protein
MEQQLLSVNETATILGLTPKCVWSWIHTARIASVRIVGSRRIERSTVEQMISEGRTNVGVVPKLTTKGGGTPHAGPRRTGKKNKPRPLPVITPVQTPVPSAGWVTGPDVLKNVSTKK